MSTEDTSQPQEAYSSKDHGGGGVYPAPPPAVALQSYHQEVPPSNETKPKGDGFWRGVCAGLCCYCCLDMCF